MTCCSIHPPVVSRSKAATDSRFRSHNVKNSCMFKKHCVWNVASFIYLTLKVIRQGFDVNSDMHFRKTCCELIKILNNNILGFKTPRIRTLRKKIISKISFYKRQIINFFIKISFYKLLIINFLLFSTNLNLLLGIPSNLGQRRNSWKWKPAAFNVDTTKSLDPLFSKPKTFSSNKYLIHSIFGKTSIKCSNGELLGSYAIYNIQITTSKNDKYKNKYLPIELFSLSCVRLTWRWHSNHLWAQFPKHNPLNNLWNLWKNQLP